MGAKFTVKNGNVEQDVPSPLFLHLPESDQSKHLHLYGVAEQDMGDLVVAPVDPSVVQVSKVVRVTMAKKVTDPNSVWGFDLTPLKVGNTDLQAKVKGAVVAILKVSVIQALELPPANTDEGMMARLFLAETASPERKGWDVADAKKSMQWMRLVLKNRLDNDPAQFNAPGAKTRQDIVRGSGQYRGFGSYPTIDADVNQHIKEALDGANDDNNLAKQAQDIAFVNAALEVAKATTEILDPCGTDYFLSGWRTAGHGGTGDNQVEFQVLMTNQFFQLKRKKAAGPQGNAPSSGQGSGSGGTKK
jgi:hypothetical protein